MEYPEKQGLDSQQQYELSEQIHIKLVFGMVVKYARTYCITDGKSEDAEEQIQEQHAPSWQILHCCQMRKMV